MHCRQTTLSFAVFAALGLAAAANAQTYTLGTVFKFSSANTGASPLASLVLGGTTLYGTNSVGGVNNQGTVYSFNTVGSVFTTLTNFASANANENQPEGSLTLSGSTLYGTTFGSDLNNLGGTVFSLPTSSVNATPTVLATFTSADGSTFPNGSNPAAGLTVVGAKLYGTTQFGGTSGGGTVFSLPIAGGTPTAVASFPAANPTGGLTLSGVTLYGTTSNGGANGDGSLFSFNTTSNTLSTPFSFNSATNSGQNPAAGVTFVGTTLYGTAEFGGAGDAGGNNQDGTLFSFNTTSNTFTTLVSFTGTANGANPTGNLLLIGSTLYGTTSSGGVNNDGTVFSFNTATSAFKTIATFNSANGASPVSGLTQGANGVLYGTTSDGGNVTDAMNNPLGDGVIFSLTPVAAPEPSPFAVFGLGVLALGALTLRARRRSLRGV